MKTARARAGNNIDLSACAATVFRPIRAALHFEFFDGIDAGRIQQAEVSAAVHVVGAVKCPVVLREAVAIDREVDLVSASTRSLDTNVEGVTHG